MKQFLVHQREENYRFTDARWKWPWLSNAFLTRFDGRYVDWNLNAEELQPVLATKSLIDLGLPITDAFSLIALSDSKLHTKILVLRLLLIDERIPLLKPSKENSLFKEAWKLLIMDKNSTVQFFDCLFGEKETSYSKFHGLAGPDIPVALTALKLGHRKHWSITQQADALCEGLAKYLCSPAARNMVYLEVDCEVKRKETTSDWKVAHSLVNNFTLCTLVFPFMETAAENYAISVLRRNRLYRDTHLFKEPAVRPDVAKLFLCGHGRVGKTTLRLALQSMHNPRPVFSTLLAGQSWLKSSPHPTRGMETHFLSSRHGHKKLLICDLAGQEEFHVFHHYFMNAGINDIFVVVCKYDTSCISLEHFNLQLEYWLRFIVSHRSSRNNSFMKFDAGHSHIKPKVIVVVNFFQQEEQADAITFEWTSPIMQRFSETLDFAVEAENQQFNLFKNLFGRVNARTRFRVPKLHERLESLLSDLDNFALPIPKLCYDISAHLTHAIGKRGHFAKFLATRKAKPRLLTSYSEVLEAMSKHTASDQSLRVEAALKELHSQGDIIFFPTEGAGAAHGRPVSMKGESDGEAKTNNTLVIIDTNWFSNKLIGSLLGTYLPDAPRRSSHPWVWEVQEIKQMLRMQGCAEHHHKEILRYLKHLELCVSLDGDPDAEKGLLLFPALVKEKMIEFLRERRASSTTFFGRRMKCKECSIHLIPFGVFTRLQVKLHKAYSAHNKSFKIGYGWVSFMKGRVEVVVRFGGDVINDAWESKQWVDMLLFCAEDCQGNSSNMESGAGYRTWHVNDPKLIAAEAVITEIRSYLYETCKEGDLGGIPTVPIDEMVLQNETESSDSVCISDILSKAITQGLIDSYQEWETGKSTHVLHLLLPKEIEAVVRGQLNVLAEIQAEFSQGSEDEAGDDVQMEHDADKQKSAEALSESQLSGDLQILESSLKSHVTLCCEDLKTEFRRIERNILQNIDMYVQIIREDIRKWGDVVQQAKQEIIANCSTQLLRHELRQDRAYPLYPYLVDVEGKLTPLWEAVFGRRVVRVHFLCESPTEGGPHPVQGQKGKEVSTDWKPWVRKAARVMVPAVKVICCLARVAVSVYLPSAHVFLPTPEFLVSGLGLERAALQQVILPEALKAFLEKCPDVEVEELMHCRPREEEVQEVIAAILKNKQVDMWADFGLKRVILDDDKRSSCASHQSVENHNRTFWVCDRHARHKAEARPVKNPYGE